MVFDLKSLTQMVKRVIKTDARILDLARSIQAALTSVIDHATIAEKAQKLKDPITRLLKQVVECGVFIYEYTRHGFAGRPIY